MDDGFAVAGWSAIIVFLAFLFIVLVKDCGVMFERNNFRKCVSVCEDYQLIHYKDDFCKCKNGEEIIWREIK